MNTYITHSGIGTEVSEISIVGLVQLINKTELVRTKLTLALHEKGKNIDSDELTLEEYKKICPVFEEDIYEAISLETCVNKRTTIGAPGREAMEQAIKIYEEYMKNY